MRAADEALALLENNRRAVKNGHLPSLAELSGTIGELLAQEVSTKLVHGINGWFVS
jgi:hypothetical protein